MRGESEKQTGRVDKKETKAIIMATAALPVIVSPSLANAGGGGMWRRCGGGVGGESGGERGDGEEGAVKVAGA